jgi:hypothetical protein
MRQPRCDLKKILPPTKNHRLLINSQKHHPSPLFAARSQIEVHPRILFIQDELQRFFLLPEQAASQWPEAAKIFPKIRSPSALTGRWPLAALI